MASNPPKGGSHNGRGSHIRLWDPASAGLIAICCLLALGSAIPFAQQPQAPAQPERPTFRTNVDLTMVDLRVEDFGGRFIRDLTIDDFEVFEDDVKQSISTFSLIDLPGVTASTTDVMGVPPDVATNASADGRLYVIVLDDMEGEKENAGMYQAMRTGNVKAIARDFVEHHLGAADRAALITTSGRKDMTVQFTNDRRRLLEAIDRFQGGFGQMTFTCAGGGNPFAQCVMVPDNVHVVMESLEAVAGWLSSISGRRKSIVLVSERLGRTPVKPPGGLSENVNPTLAAREAQDVAEFLQAASRGNVSLFAVDPVGVPGGQRGNIQPVSLDDNAQFDEFRIQSLVTLSEATGGFAGVHTNNYAEVFDRVVEENGSYYLIGYSSTKASQDGKTRKIRVEVKRRNLKVRSRSGYVAEKPADRPATPAGGLPADLNELMKSPIPVAGLTLSVAAAPFRKQGTGSVGIVVEARPSLLQPADDTGRFNGAIELAIVAADKDGRTQTGERGTLSMPLSAGARDVVARRGVRLLSSLDLKPGEYELSVAATMAGSGSPGGSVRYTLTVPDFSVPLAMSGVALGSLEASQVRTWGADARWKESLGMPPTATRVFKRSDELRVFAEIYDNEQRREHATTVTTTIRAARPPTSGDVEVPAIGPISGSAGATATGATGNGVSGAPGPGDRVVFSKRDDLPRLGGQTTFPIVTSIALSNLEPGDYLLTVEAVSSLAGNRPVSRQIPFSVTSER